MKKPVLILQNIIVSSHLRNYALYDFIKRLYIFLATSKFHIKDFVKLMMGKPIFSFLTKDNKTFHCNDLSALEAAYEIRIGGKDITVFVLW